MPILQHWNDLSSEPAGPPVDKRSLKGDGASLVRVEIAAGSLFHFPAETWHAAEFDEATVLVETNLG